MNSNYTLYASVNKPFKLQKCIFAAMLLRKVGILALLLIITSRSYCQNSRYTDSLLLLISQTRNDSLKVHGYNQLAFHHIFNNTDEALRYWQKGMALALKKKLNFGHTQLLSTKGVYYDVLGKKDSALHYFQAALAKSRLHVFPEIEVLSLNNLGMYYWGAGQFQDALSYFFKALAINSRVFPQKKESRAKYLNNIGLIYQELQQFDKAIDFHQQSLVIRSSLRLAGEQAISHANIGVCFQNKENYSKAIFHLMQAIDLAEVAGNFRLYHSFHDNLANAYQAMGWDEKAIQAYKKALERPANIQANPKSDLSTLANLASIYNKLGKPKEALQYGNEGLQILKQHSYLRNFATTLLFALAESQFMQGQSDQGKYYLDQYKAVQDSIFSASNAMALASMEKKYQAAEKDLLIAEQQRDITAKEVRMQKFISAFVVFAFLLLLVAGIVFYKYKLKKADAMEAHLKLQLAEQQKMNQIHQEKLRISRELHDNMGSYLTLLGAKLEKIEGPHTPNDLQKTLSEGMKELRNTVWLLNKQSISIEELAIKLRELVKPLSNANLMVKVSIIGDSNHRLSDLQTTHVYRIIQEAINNALKHAQCSEIGINLNVADDHRFLFIIQDNGIGLTSSENSSGNGLQNMRWRLKELNGEFSIESMKDQGTTISCSFPLA